MDAERAAAARKHPQTAANFFVGTNSRVPRMTLAQTTHIIPLPATPSPGLAPRSGVVPTRKQFTPFPSSPSSYTSTTPPRSAARVGTKVAQAVEHFSRPVQEKSSPTSASSPRQSRAATQKPGSLKTSTIGKAEAPTNVGRSDDDKKFRNIPKAQHPTLPPLPSSERIRPPHRTKKSAKDSFDLPRPAGAHPNIPSKVTDRKRRSPNRPQKTASVQDSENREHASAPPVESSQAASASFAAPTPSASEPLGPKQEGNVPALAGDFLYRVRPTSDAVEDAPVPTGLPSSEPSAQRIEPEEDASPTSKLRAPKLPPLDSDANLTLLPQRPDEALPSTSAVAFILAETEEIGEPPRDLDYIDLFSLPSSNIEAVSPFPESEVVKDVSPAESLLDRSTEVPLQSNRGSFDDQAYAQADIRIGDQASSSALISDAYCPTSPSKSQWLSRAGGVLFDMSAEDPAIHAGPDHLVSGPEQGERSVVALSDDQEDRVGPSARLYSPSAGKYPQDSEHSLTDNVQAGESAEEPKGDDVGASMPPSNASEMRPVHEENCFLGDQDSQPRMPTGSSTARDPVPSSAYLQDQAASVIQEKSKQDLAMLEHARSDEIESTPSSHDHPAMHESYAEIFDVEEPETAGGLAHSPFQWNPTELAPFSSSRIDEDLDILGELRAAPAPAQHYSHSPTQSVRQSKMVGSQRASGQVTRVENPNNPMGVAPELAAAEDGPEEAIERQTALERTASWVRNTAGDLEHDAGGGNQRYAQVEIPLSLVQPGSPKQLSRHEGPEPFVDGSGFSVSRKPGKAIDSPPPPRSRSPSVPLSLLSSDGSVENVFGPEKSTSPGATGEGSIKISRLDVGQPEVSKLHRSFSQRSQAQVAPSGQPRKIPGRLKIPSPQPSAQVRIRRQSLELLPKRKAKDSTVGVEPIDTSATLVPCGSDLAKKRSSDFDNALRMWSNPKDDEKQVLNHSDRRNHRVGQMIKDWNDEGQPSDDEEVASVAVCKRLTLKRMSGFTVHSTPRQEKPPLLFPGKLQRRAVEAYDDPASGAVGGKIRSSEGPSLVQASLARDGDSRRKIRKTPDGLSGSGAGLSDTSAPASLASASTAQRGATEAASTLSLSVSPAPTADRERQATHADAAPESVEVLRSCDSVGQLDEACRGEVLQRPLPARSQPTHRMLRQLQLPGSQNGVAGRAIANGSYIGGTASTPHTSISDMWTPDTSRAAPSALTEETRVSDRADSRAPSSSGKDLRPNKKVAQVRALQDPNSLATGGNTSDCSQSRTASGRYSQDRPKRSSRSREDHRAQREYSEPDPRRGGRQENYVNHDRYANGEGTSSEPKAHHPVAAIPAFEISFQMQEPQMAPNCASGTLFEFGVRVLVKPCSDDAVGTTWRVRPPSPWDTRTWSPKASGRARLGVDRLQYEHDNLSVGEMKRVQQEAQAQLAHTYTSPRRGAAMSVDREDADAEGGLSSPFASPGAMQASLGTSRRRPLREMVLNSSRAVSITTSRDTLTEDHARALQTPATSASRRVAPVLASPLPYIKRAPRAPVAAPARTRQ